MPMSAGNGPHVIDSLLAAAPLFIGLQAMALPTPFALKAQRWWFCQGDDSKWS